MTPETSKDIAGRFALVECENYDGDPVEPNDLDAAFLLCWSKTPTGCDEPDKVFVPTSPGSDLWV